MTQINGLQSSIYVSESSLPADVRGLSSEALLAYCETRMRDIDQGVNAQMADQTAVMNRKKALNTLIAKCNPEEKPSKKDIENIFKKAEKLAADLPEGDPTRKYLEKLRGRWDDNFGDKDKVKNQFAAFKAELESKSQELGADSEMSMIRLQSTISARQTIVSLITNMMAKMQQANEQVVANIKA